MRKGTSSAASNDTQARMEELWDLFATFQEQDDIQQSQTTTEPFICQFCSSPDIYVEEAAYICKNCNSLQERFIDATAEWRYYGAEDHKSVNPDRCGMPTNDLLPGSSLGTVIAAKPGEGMAMRNIRRQHFWTSISYRERALYHQLENINMNAISNGIPQSIINDAKVIYKKMSDNKITRGENRNGMIATSIYMSCKKNKVPRMPEEIAEIFKIKDTTLTKGCKKFQDMMRVNIENTTPEDFINRFGSKVDMSPEMRDICKQILKKSTEFGVLTTNMPQSIAAGVMYLVITTCGLDITKDELSEACGISPATILKCYKKLYDDRGKILPRDVIYKYNVT